MRKTENYLSSLPQHHQQLLIKYREHLQQVKVCIEHNAEIIKLITRGAPSIFENVNPPDEHDSVRPTLIIIIILYNIFINQ